MIPCSQFRDLGRQYREDAEAEAISEFIADKVRDLMQPGGECYPFSPENVQEAIAQQDLETMMFLAERLSSDCSSAGLAFYGVVESYWEGCAKAIAGSASTLYFDGAEK